jgi:hypothetical protein
LGCKEIRYSFQYLKATAWIYRIGVNPGVYAPVALEIGFADKAPMKNLMGTSKNSFLLRTAAISVSIVIGQKSSST